MDWCYEDAVPDIHPTYSNRADTISSDGVFTMRTTHIEMEGVYTFTYKYFDEQDVEQGSLDFDVEIIDNPCQPDLSALNNGILDVPMILGDPNTILLDFISNADCTFEINLAEADCTTMSGIPVTSSPDLDSPMVSFTQAPFTQAGGSNDTRVIEFTPGNIDIDTSPRKV